jgi:hypothetical protein
VHFKSGENKKIVNTYITRNYNAPCERKTGYILTTGKPWKGNIGKAVVTFELMNISPVRIDKEYTLPSGYKIDSNKLIWQFNNFEPEENISVALKPGIPLINMSLNWNDEKYKNDVIEKVNQVHELFAAEKIEQGLKILNSLVDKGVYCEEPYFDLRPQL